MSNDNDEWKGFEEFIQYAKIHPPVQHKKTKPEHELLTFLEDDQKRLNLQKEMFTRKVLNLKNYSQSEYLVKKQKELNHQNRLLLVEALSKDSSSLNRSLQEIFDGHFSDSEQDAKEK